MRKPNIVSFDKPNALKAYTDEDRLQKDDPLS